MSAIVALLAVAAVLSCNPYLAAVGILVLVAMFSPVDSGKKRRHA